MKMKYSMLCLMTKTPNTNHVALFSIILSKKTYHTCLVKKIKLSTKFQLEIESHVKIPVIKRTTTFMRKGY